MNYKLLLLAGILMIIIDSVYLQFISSLFNKQITLIQGTPMNIDYLGAILSYILLYIAFIYFIVLKNASLNEAFLLGFILYGVFETTNKALFTNWMWTPIIVDSLWGGTLFTLLAYILKYINRFI